ncbi:hypothetical protein [Corynebacterium guaraldiae]|nr:hypothetical protein [Corynebacterium guaraldiae]
MSTNNEKKQLFGADKNADRVWLKPYWTSLSPGLRKEKKKNKKKENNQ